MNENIINLLKQALKFYADKRNYSIDGNIAHIDLDKGNHARFALEQADKIENLMNTAEDDFVKKISTAIELNTDGSKLLNLIEKYRNLNIDDDNKI